VDPLPQYPHSDKSRFIKDDCVHKPRKRMQGDNHVPVPFLVADQITARYSYEFHSEQKPGPG
jgi:hypothetical protein